MVTAYVGLGSNLGERAAQLEQALARLAGETVEIQRISAVYESDPVGPVSDQPRFYNMVVELTTGLEPGELLEHCQVVEQQMGRERVLAQGPRTIDLDLLLMGSRIERSPDLELPHPELSRRAFVLRPLLELDPELVDPRDGQPLVSLLGPVSVQPLECLGLLAEVVAAERSSTRGGHG